MASIAAEQRILNVLVALDVFMFCLCCFGGTKRNETASSAAWSLEQDGRWQGKLFRPLIDWVFSRAQKNHCAEAWRYENPD